MVHRHPSSSHGEAVPENPCVEFSTHFLFDGSVPGPGTGNRLARVELGVLAGLGFATGDPSFGCSSKLALTGARGRAGESCEAPAGQEKMRGRRGG